MTRTSRRLKQKPTHTHTHTHTHTQRLPLLRSGRDPAPPFDPVKLALTDRIPRYTASCASLLSALPLPPLRRRGVSTILWAGVLRGSGPLSWYSKDAVDRCGFYGE